MPSKVQLYAQMADRTAEQITGSYQKWTAFLTTAARLYKYPYNEQLMIFAQRPDATACAEYDFWNEKMGRYVRRGSKGMVELRDCVQKLISEQMDGFISDETIRQTQTELNTLYDGFTAKYGLINSRANALAFAEDSSYYLLCSLEELDEDKNLKRKADMFTRRTIRAHEAVTSVDTASEALALSISEKACVDMEYMCLTGNILLWRAST